MIKNICFADILSKRSKAEFGLPFLFMERNKISFRSLGCSAPLHAGKPSEFLMSEKPLSL
jgi:hypothetical protein